MSAQSQGNSGNKILIIVLAVVVAVLVGAIVVLASNNMKSKEEPIVQPDEPQKRQTLVNEDTVDQVVEEMFEKQSSGSVPTSYDVVMTNNWTFPDGESESTDAYVENAKSNTTDMYFDVRLTDTQETIYESPVIPLGQHIDKIKLMKDLEPGTYDCELTYHLIDDEQNTLGTIDVVVTVVVKN